jgi:PPOX class probable F420-dependent enzyme
MSLRDAVRMSADEVAAFLAGPRTLNIATVGSDGAIHIVAMWYAMHGECPVFTTYGRSQKVVNLRRDPRLTGLVESGHQYDELRGVELIGTARIVDDPVEVLEVVRELSVKYSGRSLAHDAEKAAARRVAIVLEPQRVISWDHGKLAAAAR